ncbi:MAG: ribonuclease H-like domain-containing protein [Candidatus Nanohaloarchaea archaeon]
MRIENSFVLAPGVGEKTEQKLWEQGITHWDGFRDSNALGSKKREKILDFLKLAERNLDVGNSVFFQDKLPNQSMWRAYQNFKENACFFDIETTGLDRERNRVTTVSFYRAGEAKTLVRGQDLTRERIEEELFESSILVSFNGKRFDQPFLEHNFDLEIETPHLDLMYICKRLGLSGGLKSIEKQLGIDRELEDIDGREAVRLWKKYENEGDEDALQKLVRYNKHDARNLKDVLEVAHSRLRKEVFEPYTG